jgi:SAM-dependent methyltransferase
VTKKSFALTDYPEINSVLDDMRVFVRPGAFDLAISLFTSFGYFEDDRDDQRILQNLHASLKPGAPLVMDVASKERIAKVLLPTVSQRAPDGTLRVQRHQITDDWTRVKNEWLFIKDERVRTFTFSLRIYSGQELKALLATAGFRRITLYGGLDGRPYDGGAERLVVLAVK